MILAYVSVVKIAPPLGLRFDLPKWTKWLPYLWVQQRSVGVGTISHPGNSFCSLSILTSQVATALPAKTCTHSLKVQSRARITRIGVSQKARLNISDWLKSVKIDKMTSVVLFQAPQNPAGKRIWSTRGVLQGAVKDADVDCCSAVV
jgi:hypothetical protein